MRTQCDYSMLLIGKGLCYLTLSVLMNLRSSFAYEEHPLTGNLHASPEYLGSVFAFDKLVGDSLKYLVTPSEAISSYAESYGWLVTDAVKYGGEVVHPAFIGHPLHVYAMIKRLVNFYPEIRSIFLRYKPSKVEWVCVNNHTSCDFWARNGRCIEELEYMTEWCPETCGICDIIDQRRILEEAENRTYLPSPPDLSGAAEAIGTLQNVYGLPISDLIRGKIYDTYSSVELNDWDCARIGRGSARLEKLASAWLWYNHIIKSTKNQEMKSYCSEILSNIASIHDKKWKDHEDYFPKKLAEAPLQSPRRSSFYALCRGEELPRKDEGLKCEVTSRGHPYFILQPVKHEPILKDPEMHIFYDVVSENEMETLKQLSMGNLIRDPGSRRVSQMAFLEEQHPLIDSLNRRASFLSGLTLDEGTEESVAAEPLKVRNYGTGGHLVPHADVYYKHKPDAEVHPKAVYGGDRIATFMYYLSDVEYGGRTAFHRLNVSLTPSKGNAVFWYNLKHNGSYDKRIDHGGCPVVLGNKWLALRWFREEWNFQARPCTLVREE